MKLHRLNAPIVLGIVLLALSVTPLNAAAQQAPGTVRGIVIDQVTNAPVPDARVRVDSQSLLTDDDGRFEFIGVQLGPQSLTADQYGYQPVVLRISVARDSVPEHELRLPPAPVMLEGIEVVTERLQLMERRIRSRRNAAAVSSRAFNAEALTRSPARNVAEFLVSGAGLRLAQCGRSGRTEFPACLSRRGESVRPSVYLDEAPMAGGLAALGGYPPDDLHMIEVYAEGLEIRVFTRQFMDQMARQPIVLFPVNIGR